MISTLNPKISGYIVIFNLAMLVYFSYMNKYSSVAFSIGFFAALPIAYHLWATIEMNWKNLYRKFHMTKLSERNFKIVVQSWRKIWWLLPSSIIIYVPISFGLMRFSTDIYLLLACISGSVCATAWVSSQKSPKYYEDLVRSVK